MWPQRLAVTIDHSDEVVGLCSGVLVDGCHLTERFLHDGPCRTECSCRSLCLHQAERCDLPSLGWIGGVVVIGGISEEVIVVLLHLGSAVMSFSYTQYIVNR